MSNVIDDERAFNLINEAEGRVLSSDEWREIRSWAEDAATTLATPGAHYNEHKLTRWAVSFTKQTRAHGEPFFAENFRQMWLLIMPLLSNIFESDHARTKNQ